MEYKIISFYKDTRGHEGISRTATVISGLFLERRELGTGSATGVEGSDSCADLDSGFPEEKFRQMASFVGGYSQVSREQLLGVSANSRPPPIWDMTETKGENPGEGGDGEYRNSRVDTIHAKTNTKHTR